VRAANLAAAQEMVGKVKPVEATKPPGDDILDKKADIDATVRGLDEIESSAIRIANAFQNRLNSEIENTAIALKELPVDALVGMSQTLGDSVANLLTLQGGFEDFGKNILRGLQSILAQTIALIIQQKVLNALKAKDLALTQATAAASGAGGFGGLFGGAASSGLLGALGPFALAFGGAMMLSSLFNRDRTTETGSTSAADAYEAMVAANAWAHPSMTSEYRRGYGSDSYGPTRDARAREQSLAITGVTLPSGDIAFSVNENRAIRSRVGY
jgi:hypothetical protein